MDEVLGEKKFPESKSEKPPILTVLRVFRIALFTRKSFQLKNSVAFFATVSLAVKFWFVLSYYFTLISSKMCKIGISATFSLLLKSLSLVLS